MASFFFISYSSFFYLSDRTDSCSSASFSIESNKKPTIISVTPTKPNVPFYQPSSKENRLNTNEKTNGNLRESLDELNRLSNRVDDNENNR